MIISTVKNGKVYYINDIEQTKSDRFTENSNRDSSNQIRAQKNRKKSINSL